MASHSLSTNSCAIPKSHSYGVANIVKPYTRTFALPRAPNDHFPGCLAGDGHCVPTQQSITPLSHCPYELAALSTRFLRSQPFTKAKIKAKRYHHAIYTCMPQVALMKPVAYHWGMYMQHRRKARRTVGRAHQGRFLRGCSRWDPDLDSGMYGGH